MITSVHSASIFVTDQDRALDFYVSKCGFQKQADMPMGPDSRWIEVVPPGAKTAVLLYKPTPQMPGADSYEQALSMIGKFSNILFNTDDLNRTYDELSSKGVAFPTPPEQQPWGWWAVMADPDGNSFGMRQEG
jgi:predicted enzyme related to lactoylglutathione lyase